MAILEVENLRKVYRSRRGLLGREEETVAVDGVTFEVEDGETFGLVGESGCGKTTIARCILRLVAADGGTIRFGGRDLLTLPPPELKAVRRELQMVFQDPYSSLNPRMTVAAILREPLDIHAAGSRRERDIRVRELAGLVGLSESSLSKFPHEFSGGQRQRIGIARALALSPRLVIADEPVSALDLSIRAQVINLMADLQEQLGLAYLLIAHDLTLVRHVCRRVAVMHRGRIVELAPAEALFASPAHPYTRRLMAAIPEPDPDRRPEPLPPAPPEADEPPLREVGTGHFARVA